MSTFTLLLNFSASVMLCSLQNAHTLAKRPISSKTIVAHASKRPVYIGAVCVVIAIVRIVSTFVYV